MNPFDEIAVEEVSLRENVSLRQYNFQGELIMSTDVRPARLLSKRISGEPLLSDENEAKQGFEKFYRFLSTVIFFVEELEIHELCKFKAEKSNIQLGLCQNRKYFTLK